jgi:hypothetical protein
MRRILIILIIILIISSCSGDLPYSIGGGEEPDEWKIFLPVIRNTKIAYSKLLSVGVHMQVVNMDEVDYIVPGTTAILELYWSRIEIEPGIYTWNSDQDAVIQALHAKGVTVLLRAKNSPTWARVHSEYECSEPRPEYYDDYARFIVAAMHHFGVYSVAIWNEPNSSPGAMLPPNDHYFGCWGGTRNDGRRYGKLVQTVYDEVLVQIPGATLLVGEVCCNAWNTFVPGIVDVLGGISNLSYHSYHVYEGNSPNTPLKDLNRYAKFATDSIYLSEMNMIAPGRTGTAVLPKIGFSYHSFSVIDGNAWNTPITEGKKYAFVGLPLYLTGSNRIANRFYNDNCLGLEQEQADWLEWIIPRLRLEGVQFIGIYAVKSWWRCADLVRGTRKTPEWDVYARFGE